MRLLTSVSRSAFLSPFHHFLIPSQMATNVLENHFRRMPSFHTSRDAEPEWNSLISLNPYIFHPSRISYTFFFFFFNEVSGEAACRHLAVACPARVEMCIVAKGVKMEIEPVFKCLLKHIIWCESVVLHQRKIKWENKKKTLPSFVSQCLTVSGDIRELYVISIEFKY